LLFVFDAILVTDNVNTPIGFSRQFIDKDRFMMELFTMDSVKDGVGQRLYQQCPHGA
jgi:hypothetical protein